MKLSRATEIPKEELHLLNFSEIDVLASQQERSLRKHHLEKALKLGNLYHQKVSIYFYDANGDEYYVHTTIWAICGEVISLKCGQVLPIKAISEVIF